MLPAKRLMAAHMALVAAATAVYLTVRTARGPVWAVIGLSGTAAVLIGSKVNRPAHRWPWWVLAAAPLTFVAGGTYYNVVEEYFHASNPFPSPADASCLSTYPLLAIGLSGLVRYRWAGHDLPSPLDALIILGDVLVLALPARLLTPNPVDRHNRSVQYLVVGTVTLLGFDIAYGILQLDETWQAATVSASGWMVFCTARGQAALRPGMVQPTAALPQQGSASTVSAVRQQEVARSCGAAVDLLLGTMVGHRTLLLPAERAPYHAQIVHARDLGTDTGAELDEAATVLVCLMIPPDRPYGDVPVVLLVAGPAETLAERRGPIEIVASHAGPAMERIALRQEIVRGESEAYFRTLVRNTSDVILIVEDDNTIRYAGLSAATVFGTSDVAGESLPDLVGPRDRHRAARELTVLEGALVAARLPRPGHGAGRAGGRRPPRGRAARRAAPQGRPGAGAPRRTGRRDAEHGPAADHRDPAGRRGRPRRGRGVPVGGGHVRDAGRLSAGAAGPGGLPDPDHGTEPGRGHRAAERHPDPAGRAVSAECEGLRRP
ncbi:PAS domain-containing protein [Streptomyces sp. NPDC051172]|uniref:PAS domain-containing protein n=1 Tax=Streptomyces sp. NPDC051172 TaxID=3155796 RepID=UPI003449FB2B